MHYVSGIIELDEQEEVLKSIGRFNLQWTDELLKWHAINEALAHNKRIYVSLVDKPTIEGSVLLTLQIVSIFYKYLKTPLQFSYNSHRYSFAIKYKSI